jgi:hypothetical protein
MKELRNERIKKLRQDRYSDKNLNLKLKTIK